jgi:hypothetical protein
MASEEQKLLANAVKPMLKMAEFKKTAFYWHRKQGNVIQVVNFQGSQWSKTVYVNLGVFFLDIEEQEKPKEYDCHIRQRLPGISPDLKRCNELFNLENSLSNEERYSEVVELLETVAIPWLERCSSKEGAKYYLEHEKKHGLPVPVAAKRYLGIHSS